MNQSSILFKEAKEYIPGGVNSPVRAFNGVGGDPVFFDRGEYKYHGRIKTFADTLRKNGLKF